MLAAALIGADDRGIEIDAVQIVAFEIFFLPAKLAAKARHPHAGTCGRIARAYPFGIDGGRGDNIGIGVPGIKIGWYTAQLEFLGVVAGGR
ncbi:hypothetical protein D3C81_1594390 [compost metagenome]